MERLVLDSPKSSHYNPSAFARTLRLLILRALDVGPGSSVGRALH
jgi:hypothetical protein